MSTDTELAILGVSEVASLAMISALLNKSSVEEVRAKCEASVYWPEFCRAVAAGYDPEDKLPGALGRCVKNWTQGCAFRVRSRPCGDFAVEKWDGTRIVRWGVYDTKEKAAVEARLANTPPRTIAAVTAALR